MTKKHFIAIAKMLADAAEYASEYNGEEMRAKIAHELCSIMQSDNSAFDRARFLRAANVAER